MDFLARDNKTDSKSAVTEERLEASDETSEEDTFPQKRVDALLRLAEHFPAHPGQEPASLSNDDKYQVLVHLDLRQDSETADTSRTQTAHLVDGPPLNPETIERLSCDASLVPVSRDQTGNSGL